jgi:hypothetical protein
MSFLPPPHRGEIENARADLADVEAKAERYSQLHGTDDGPPAPGPLRRLVQRLTGAQRGRSDRRDARP